MLVSEQFMKKTKSKSAQTDPVTSIHTDVLLIIITVV